MTLIEEWLAAKGVTLWGDWNINDPEQLKKAAHWFGSQMADYGAFCADRAMRHATADSVSWDVV